ncbi:MAG TPA: glutamate ABC transporter substrate-binding protein [Streptosporangiaceae bacterium]|nr:glutamate ABC transporter substrate-binding protein [Streptosporangiaceae bacterium]
MLKIVTTALLAVGLTACAAAGPSSAAGKSTLVIGVKADQPGLGLAGPGGQFSGFEVEVGTYIARKLGASKVGFKAVTSYNREKLLNQGAVDLVLASYSITPQRDTLVTFGGPYYLAHQDTMVRSDETRIRTVHDLAGRRMCEAAGSVSTQRVTAGLGIAARLVPSPSYSDCYAKLLSGQVDAVSTGDLVLAGFVAQANGAVRIIGDPFSDERYGVGLRKGDIDGCEAVNRAITAMYQDGTAARLLRKWFGTTGLPLAGSTPQFEGCA